MILLLEKICIWIRNTYELIYWISTFNHDTESRSNFFRFSCWNELLNLSIMYSCIPLYSKHLFKQCLEAVWTLESHWRRVDSRFDLERLHLRCMLLLDHVNGFLMLRWLNGMRSSVHNQLYQDLITPGVWSTAIVFVAIYSNLLVTILAQSPTSIWIGRPPNEHSMSPKHWRHCLLDYPFALE